MSLDLPQGRLTVCTGVSGSAKSSLVFGTILAGSQRLINETYSAFLQSCMPAQGRPPAPSSTASPTWVSAIRQGVTAHADRIIDEGPGIGQGGGRIAFTGTPAGLVASSHTLTSRAGRFRVGVPPRWGRWIDT